MRKGRMEGRKDEEGRGEGMPKDQSVAQDRRRSRVGGQYEQNKASHVLKSK